MHVIILDQNRLRQQWYTQALAGHVISFVDTALGAVRLAQSVPTGAIVAEYFEDAGGLLLDELRRVVENIGFMAPPVFLIGDVPKVDVAERATLIAQNRGARDFITRPISRQRFRDIVAPSTPLRPRANEASKEGVLRMRITRVQAPPHSPQELAELTMTLPNVRQLIEETVGFDWFVWILEEAIRVHDRQRVLKACAGLGIWATEESPALYAISVVHRLGDRQRNPLGELKYRIAEALLYPHAA